MHGAWISEKATGSRGVRWGEAVKTHFKDKNRCHQPCSFAEGLLRLSMTIFELFKPIKDW